MFIFVSRQPVAGQKQRSGDVLSEIDNMLQGLTDELDAMLEFDLAEWIKLYMTTFLLFK